MRSPQSGSEIRDPETGPQVAAEGRGSLVLTGRAGPCVRRRSGPRCWVGVRRQGRAACPGPGVGIGGLRKAALGGASSRGRGPRRLPSATLTMSRSGSTTVRLGESTSVQLTRHEQRAQTPLRGRPYATPGRRGAGNAPQSATTTPSPPKLPKETAPRPYPSSRAATTRIDTFLTPTRRGDRSLTGSTVRSLGPLGLAGRQTSYEGPPWPPAECLPPFERPQASAVGAWPGLHETDGRTQVLVRGQGQRIRLGCAST